MWTLDYDGAMLMRMDQSPEAFTSGGFYKLFLRRYVKEVLPGFVRFKPALSYLDFKKIIALCQREGEKQGFEVAVSSALQDYIDGREMHIDLRSRLGIELKDHDPKLLERFQEYPDGGVPAATPCLKQPGCHRRRAAPATAIVAASTAGIPSDEYMKFSRCDGLQRLPRCLFSRHPLTTSIFYDKISPINRAVSVRPLVREGGSYERKKSQPANYAAGLRCWWSRRNPAKGSALRKLYKKRQGQRRFPFPGLW